MSDAFRNAAIPLVNNRAEARNVQLSSCHSFRLRKERKPKENPEPGNVSKRAVSKSRMHALAWGLENTPKRSFSASLHFTSGSIPQVILTEQWQQINMHRESRSQPFHPTKNMLASVGLVHNCPKAEVSSDYCKIVIWLGYLLPVVIRTSLCISHLIKINESEQAVTKGPRCASTPRGNSRPTGAIAGAALPLESPYFTQNWSKCRNDRCYLCCSCGNMSQSDTARPKRLSSGSSVCFFGHVKRSLEAGLDPDDL